MYIYVYLLHSRPSTGKKNQQRALCSSSKVLGTGRANGTYKYSQEFLVSKLIEQYSHLGKEEHNENLVHVSEHRN
jgi:hypothetical protein